MSKLIPLTQGYSTIVDDDDYDYLMQWKWQINTSATCGILYAKRTSSRPNRKTILMHREVMKLDSIPPFIDHINHNGLDNRKANLRICTNSQNQANRLTRPNCSGFRGVSYYRRDNKWRAQIQFQKRNINLGYFDKPIEAAIAYDVAALMLFGKFATINGV